MRLSVSEPPTIASLPHPATISVVNPHGANGTVGRHTGRTVDGYVLAVNGVLNYACMGKAFSSISEAYDYLRGFLC